MGLYLWADGVRGDGSGAEELVARADRAFAGAEGIQGREGQEVAWLALGMLRNAAARDSATGSALLRTAVDELLERANRCSGLLDHYGDGRFRRRFANFATQIYGLLALSAAAAEDERALPAARALADRLIALQLADGGWPWLDDVDRGSVAERYEVYSVHQHAMAPMGLLELFEATGERRYADAAAHGLGWIHGRNELGLEMVDEGEQLIYRSIRRRRPFDRLVLYASTATLLVARRNPTFAGKQLELNATCRPYELGWLLEAWHGREHLAGDVRGRLRPSVDLGAPFGEVLAVAGLEGAGVRALTPGPPLPQLVEAREVEWRAVPDRRRASAQAEVAVGGVDEPSTRDPGRVAPHAEEPTKTL